MNDLLVRLVSGVTAVYVAVSNAGVASQKIVNGEQDAYS
jgi:hypothetical protein